MIVEGLLWEASGLNIVPIDNNAFLSREISARQLSNSGLNPWIQNYS